MKKGAKVVYNNDVYTIKELLGAMAVITDGMTELNVNMSQLKLFICG